jgi:hypothetical protein
VSQGEEWKARKKLTITGDKGILLSGTNDFATSQQQLRVGEGSE